MPPPAGGPNPQSGNPTQLTINWGSITFPGSGLGISGQMQVILYSNGNYNFNGQFYDPDMLDYDDSLAFEIVGSTGVALTFSHTGTMHGWGDRWLEGGSATDSWANTGTNPTIAAQWNNLCAGYRWHANAAINLDAGDLLTDVENILKAVAAVVQVVQVVAAAAA